MNVINNSCPHCDSHALPLKYSLFETKNFRVVCDVHPLVEGHVLIIPKNHLSCVGEFSEDVFNEFISLYNKFSTFLIDSYGSVSSFEHGKIGQTVFHAHTHLVPFEGKLENIISEGADYVQSIIDLHLIKDIFNDYGQYLFLSIGDDKWVVDVKIGVPRFFRDRFALALENPERGDWKKMERDTKLMVRAIREISALQRKWAKYNEK